MKFDTSDHNKLLILTPVNIIPHFFRSAEARAHASLGYVYELLQDIDKAIDHYEQVFNQCKNLINVKTINLILNVGLCNYSA